MYVADEFTFLNDDDRPSNHYNDNVTLASQSNDDVISSVVGEYESILASGDYREGGAMALRAVIDSDAAETLSGLQDGYLSAVRTWQDKDIDYHSCLDLQ